jgi:hypothetical protein
LTVDGKSSDQDMITALRVEVEGWGPRQVPHLVDLDRPPDDLWRRSVARASAMGAAALATLLLASLLMLALAPAIPGGDVIREHLMGR